MKKISVAYTWLLLLVVSITSCHKDHNNNNNNNPGDINESTDVKGYGLFSHINGIWTGSITSSTSVGNFPDYTADFRPISPAQVSAKNEMDKKNDLFMSFFIVWHCDGYKLAFRNGGYFSGMQRISYLVIDSVSETAQSAFYRFQDFKAGTNRSYADLLFVNDSLYMRVYTNKYNTLSTAVMHFKWDAGRQDLTNPAAQSTIAHFAFPKKQMVKDFCKAFDGRTESIYYDTLTDVYPHSAQPYMGKTTVNVTLPNGVDTTGKKIFLIITTQPLFSGITPQLQNLKYKSRYVLLSAADPSFDFNFMHPGNYYLYGLMDMDGNNTFSSGDYMGSNFSYTFTLGEKESKVLPLALTFQIP